MNLAKEFGIEYYDQNVKGTKVTQLGDEGKVRVKDSKSWKILNLIFIAMIPFRSGHTTLRYLTMAH